MVKVFASCSAAERTRGIEMVDFDVVEKGVDCIDFGSGSGSGFDFEFEVVEVVVLSD
jgi:hypothetical protein